MPLMIKKKYAHLDQLISLFTVYCLLFPCFFLFFDNMFTYFFFLFSFFGLKYFHLLMIEIKTHSEPGSLLYGPPLYLGHICHCNAKYHSSSHIFPLCSAEVSQFFFFLPTYIEFDLYVSIQLVIEIEEYYI
jgi:hypothetical protein